ncbi:MAG: hypothetical protein WC208_12860 [Gallionella sp.]|jgi:hypothetical protein
MLSLYSLLQTGLAAGAGSAPALVVEVVFAGIWRRTTTNSSMRLFYKKHLATENTEITE